MNKRCFICHKRFRFCTVLEIENTKTGGRISVHEECFEKMMHGNNDNQAAQKCLHELVTPKKIGQMTFGEFLQKCAKEKISNNEFLNQLIVNGMERKYAEDATEAYALIQESINSGRVSMREDKRGRMLVNKEELLRFEANLSPRNETKQ